MLGFCSSAACERKDQKLVGTDNPRAEDGQTGCVGTERRQLGGNCNHCKAILHLISVHFFWT